MYGSTGVLFIVLRHEMEPKSNHMPEPPPAQHASKYSSASTQQGGIIYIYIFNAPGRFLQSQPALKKISSWLEFLSCFCFHGVKWQMQYLTEPVSWRTLAKSLRTSVMRRLSTQRRWASKVTQTHCNVAALYLWGELLPFLVFSTAQECALLPDHILSAVRQSSV